MYQLSRAIYRELSHDIAGGKDEHEAVLRACEATIERMVSDQRYFARPARALFRDVRPHFDIVVLPRVWQVVDGYVSATQEMIERMPRTGIDAAGNPVQCRATTRRGTPCQRVPLHSNGYCPSHQHLAETEGLETMAA
ncbi:MAG: hypothetical protein QOF29_4006 [bacterium]|jgi:hypothetical protein